MADQQTAVGDKPQKTLLLVDDTPENLTVLGEILLPHYRVRVVNSGVRALHAAVTEPRPDLILLDVMMPEMDGYEATRRIREDPRFSRLPVIALTAKAMKGDREACLKAGASDYITKPVDLDRLLSLLRVWLYNQG